MITKRGHGPTKELQGLNWEAFDYVSRAPSKVILTYAFAVCVGVSPQALSGLQGYPQEKKKLRQREWAWLGQSF